MGSEDEIIDERMQGKPCPLCKGADSVRLVDDKGPERSIVCSSCGAVWRLTKAPPLGPLPIRPRLRARAALRQPILAKLVEPGNTEEGRKLLGVERPLRLWRPMSGFAPMRSGPAQVIREVVKIRCKYCNNIYDLNQGKCPNCGAPP
jgi:hypothetical protein